MFGGDSPIPSVARSWRQDVDEAGTMQDELAAGPNTTSTPTVQTTSPQAAYVSPVSTNPKKVRKGPYKKQRNKRSRR